MQKRQAIDLIYLFVRVFPSVRLLNVHGLAS
jgi:hypothetical protein